MCPFPQQKITSSCTQTEFGTSCVSCCETSVQTSYGGGGGGRRGNNSTPGVIEIGATWGVGDRKV